MRRGVSLGLFGLSLGLFGLWTLVGAGAVSAQYFPKDRDAGTEDQADGGSDDQADGGSDDQANDHDADKKVSVPDTTTSAPPEAEKAFRKPSYEPYVGFKLLDPVDPKSNPYSLTVTGNMETRFFSFVPSKDTAVDSTGDVQSIRNLNLFEISRFMLTFYGFVGTPNVTYNFSLFATTTGDPFTLVGGAGYIFGDFLHLQIGVFKVPGTREWTESYKFHFGVDRSMVTTFLRPNISPGLFADGKMGKHGTYQAAIANGANGSTYNASRPTANFAYVFSPLWEPMGPYGMGFSDVEYHARPAVRLGGTGLVAPKADVSDLADGNPENTILRLSDGTELAKAGALGPGVTVEFTDQYLVTVDFGLKVRGTSLSFEYMFRCLCRLQATGGTPSMSRLFQHGGYLYVGHVWPKHVELYGRTGFATGEFGTGWEAGAGANYFIKGSRYQRAVLEVLYYDDNPADNALTPYRAFYSGTAIQLEYYVGF